MWFICVTSNMLKVLPICLLLAVLPHISTDETANVYSKLKSGFHLAGKLLGIDEANGVAQLVSEAFGRTHKKGDAGEGNIFSSFLRILGFDSRKIGAITINAIIFIAQLISSSLSVSIPSQLGEARRPREGSPLDWMMNNSEVLEMLSHVKDHNLPNEIINYVKERSLDEDTDCVQLLVCKTSPFIWKMQNALNSTIVGSKVLYAHLPTVEEIANNGDVCEKKHPFCFVDL